MQNGTQQIVHRLWNYCDVLRDDGVSYGDYVEQLTYLLFLKMDHERHEFLGKPSAIPGAYRWDRLLKDEDGNDRLGDSLESQYRKTLQALQKEGGLLGIIFRKSQNRIQNPTRLRRLIEYIDSEGWTPSFGQGVPGDTARGHLWYYTGGVGVTIGYCKGRM